jgi:DsbC/DsbD-like thiol-disulfide interchange protein
MRGDKIGRDIMTLLNDAFFASFIAVSAIFITSSAAAQSPVTWTATAPTKVVAGGKTSVKVTAAIEEGWHIYSITQAAGGPQPTRIILPDSQVSKTAKRGNQNIYVDVKYLVCNAQSCRPSKANVVATVKVID